MFKNRKLIFLSALLMLIVLIGCASAADVNDIQQATEGSAGEIITDEVSSAGIDDNSGLKELENENVLTNSLNESSENDNVLTANIPVTGNTFQDIQDAIDSASEGDTIQLNSIIYIGSGKQINVNKNQLTIIGSDGCTLDAQNLSRIFNVTGNNVIIQNIKFINGFINTSQIGGGAIMWTGMYGKLADSTFINNSANITGGAIIWDGRFGLISNSTFTDNLVKFQKNGYGYTVAYGGAIRWRGGNGTITNSTFTNNIVNSLSTYYYPDDAYGGAISWEASNGTITNSTFTNNLLTGAGNSNQDNYGGAIYWSGSNGTVANSTFTNNSMNRTGTNMGAAICVYAKDVIIANSTFTNNTAKGTWGEGGAIYMESDAFGTSSNISVSNCTFKNNTANYYGGAIYMESNSSIIFNSTFIDNEGAHGGGAICASTWNNQYGINNTVANCSFIHNCASNGGAIDWGVNNGTIANSTFESNYYISSAISPDSQGGAIRFSGSNGMVANSSFTNHSMDGHAIYWNGKNATIYNSTFENNQRYNNNYGPTGGGGAVHFIDVDNSYISYSTFINNCASLGGAIYYQEKYANTGNYQVSDSYFIDNKVVSTNLTGVLDTDNSVLVLTFEGNENYINAIYSSKYEVQFRNVTFWNGTIVNSDDFAPSKSQKEVGINITIEVYNSKNELIDNVTAMTDAEGHVYYDYSNLEEKCTYKAYHPDDTYYTYIETLGTFDLSYNVIVLDNSTVFYLIDQTGDIKLIADIRDSYTGKRIGNDNLKLFFILPDGTEIEGIRNSYGSWEAPSPFTQAGIYTISARVEPIEFDGYKLNKVYTGRIVISDSIPQLTINKTANASIVGNNSLVNFTIEITNVGQSDALLIQVLDAIPYGMEFVNATEGYYYYYDSIGWDVANLPAGESRSVWITLRAINFGTQENLAGAITAGMSNYIIDNAIVEVVPVALTVNKTADVSNAYVGDEITFTINVTNMGDANATNIVVKDILPEGLELIDGDLVSIIDFLEPHSSKTIIIKAKVIMNGTLTNEVHVSCLENSTIVTDNFTVEAKIAPLTVVVISNDPNVKVGEPVSFTIVVTNIGDCELSEISVVNVFPDGLIYNGFEGSSWSKLSSGLLTGAYRIGLLGASDDWSQDGNKFTYSGVLKPGESANYTLFFNTSKVGTFVVEATASSNMTSGAYANNTTDVYDEGPVPTNDTDNSTDPEPNPEEDTNPNPNPNPDEPSANEGSQSAVMEKTGNPILVLLLAVLACLPILRRKQ